MKKNLLFVFLLFSFLGYSQVPNSERDALLALYNSTDGPNWQNKWNTDLSVDKWYGITVENDHVVEINLRYNKLNGTLPTELTNLTYLRKLDFYYNTLSGILPDFSAINTLEEFNVYHNNLEGTLPDFSLTSLKNIDVSYNKFSGPIPDLSSLPNLSFLKINNNYFQFGDFENQYVYYKNNLETFTYSPQYKIDEESINDIIIGDNYSFDISPVSGTNITYQWFKNEIPINGATNRIYTITNAELTDAGDYVCKAYSSLITDLVIERNIIHLYAPCIQSDKDALMAIYNATAGDSWTNNDNWGTNEPVYTWFGVSMEGSRVTRLVFDDYHNGNNLVGELPADIGNLSALKELRINGNQELEGEIPSEIGNLSELKTLILWNNGFSGEIPSEIGNLIKLEFFSLEDNFLTGNIPETFSNLVNMKSFWLNGNLLTGDLPYIFDNWTQLQDISIGQYYDFFKPDNYNSFSGFLKIDNKNNLNGVWTDKTNIQGINVKNSNESQIKFFSSRDCSDLTCIVVSDENADYLANWNVPDQVVFMTTDDNCGALDLPELSLDNILIYPNPTKDMFTLNLDANLSLKNISLYSLSGVLIKNFEVTSKVFSIKNLKKGIYIVQIETNRGIYNDKLIIK